MPRVHCRLRTVSGFAVFTASNYRAVARSLCELLEECIPSELVREIVQPPLGPVDARLVVSWGTVLSSRLLQKASLNVDGRDAVRWGVVPDSHATQKTPIDVDDRPIAKNRCKMP